MVAASAAVTRGPMRAAVHEYPRLMHCGLEPSRILATMSELADDLRQTVASPLEQE